jgi:hypothetical protein
VTAVWIDDDARDRMRRLVLAEAQRLADTPVTTLQLLEGLVELRSRVRRASAAEVRPARVG